MKKGEKSEYPVVGWFSHNKIVKAKSGECKYMDDVRRNISKKNWRDIQAWRQNYVAIARAL